MKKTLTLKPSTSFQGDVKVCGASASTASSASMSNPATNDNSNNTPMGLCENLWVNITTFLTSVDIDNIKPINLHKHSSASKEQEEQSLRYTCKDLRQLLTSEEYYQAKVMETFGRKNGDASNGIDKWPSAESVGGWRALYYYVLSIYAPLEGWCTLCEAWPWGLLLRCEFDKGCFHGDLVRVFQSTDASDSSYHIISDRVFEISFGKGGEARCSMFDKSDFANEFGISFQPVSFQHHNTIFPRKMGGFTFQIMWHMQEDDGSRLEWDPRQDIFSLPLLLDAGGGPPSGAKLVEGLRRRSLGEPLEGLHRIRLECLGLLLETPKSASDLFQASAIMPSLKSGLYVGNYGNGEMYGQFKHEIVHISYIDAKNSNSLQATFGNRIPHDADRFQESVLIIARKITGDVHVPAGEITWFVDISNKSSGEPPERVKDKDGNRYRVINSWSGSGTLAAYFFNSPSWSEGWLLQLHDGRFAFCWASFRSQDITILHELPNQ